LGDGQTLWQKDLQMTEFSGLVFSELEGKLLARNEPVPERPPLDNEMLRELLKQAGYGGWFLLEGAVAGAPLRSR
jgi:hypothetical protein